jgi:AraC family transcriptional regulator, regulatory protein of adaptative response / methylated-DNA-[protein]-cysteine methyltransferase
MRDVQESARLDPARHAGMTAAIDYLVVNYQERPSLAAVAASAGMSPFHFQRSFKRWTGISPKRFAQYLAVGHAKRVLDADQSVLDAALDAGLSGPGRLHDLFVACEAVTPGEYKARGRDLAIRYGFHEGPFGRVLLGVTERGICWLSFVGAGGDEEAEAIFAAEWPAARLARDDAGTAEAADRAFRFALSGRAAGDGAQPRLLLRGTNFQIKVWEALLRIPPGAVASYADVARAVGRPGAVRAVGRAVGANPVSLLIPCHRVILKSGVIHNYRWGVARKRVLLALEAARCDAEAPSAA